MKQKVREEKEKGKRKKEYAELLLSNATRYLG